jgi:hypothetical protein
MDSRKTDGRVIGVLLLLQMAAGLIVPFVLIDSLVKGYPAYLETAANNSGRIRVATVIAFIGAGLTVALGVWMNPILGGYSKRAALWFLAVCVISAALDAVHNASVTAMLTAGEKFAESGGADGAVYRSLAAAAAAIRRSAHIVQLFGIGAWMASFHISAWRFRLVPRPIATLGIAGVACQFMGVTAMMLLGYPVIGYLAMPLAPIHAAAAIWLIVKGFLVLPNEETTYRSDAAG